MRPGQQVRIAFVALGLAFTSLNATTAQQPAPAATPPPPPGTPTKPLVPVAASTLGNNPAPYYGEFVSLAGLVDQSLSKTAFSVDQDRTKSTGKEIVVLTRLMTGAVDLNTYVTVIGEVVKFDPAEIAAKAKEFTQDLPPDVIAKYRDRPVILASSVINVAGLDLTKRYPPPMTPEEEAYQKIMKGVASSNAALRKGVEASDPKLAAEHSAALKKAFAEAAAFWRSKRKGDATSWSQDAQKIADSIDRAAAAGKWEEAKASVATLGKTCQTCHAAYRERFDDGSFRIKLGMR
jgi:soluble cytochrome b562